MDDVFDHNLSRLSDDHANARLIAERIATSQHINVDLATVQTNIRVFHLLEDAPDAPAVIVRARERGLRVFAFGSRTIRAATHLDVSQAQCAQAADLLSEIVDQWPN